MTLYRWLNELSISDVGTFGGKAARLGEAISLGCPVPEGMALSTELFHRFMRQGGLSGEIASILSTLQPTTWTQFQAAEWAIRSAFRVRRIPGAVAEAIEEALELVLRNADEPCVCAIRSSATREDSPTQSFVGQHYSALSVQDAESAIEAVTNCWLSLFSAKSLAYAYHFKVDLLSTAMAVIMQRAIEPSTVGALCTVDPITGCPDEFVVEVQRGTNVGLHRLDPYERKPGESRLFSRLRHLGLLLDEHHRQYQTVEWAHDGDHLWILRVRPVTGSPPYIGERIEDRNIPERPYELVLPEGQTPRQAVPYSWYHRSRSPSIKASYLRYASRVFSDNTGKDETYLNGYLYARWRTSGIPLLVDESHRLRAFFLSLRRVLAARQLDREFQALWETSRPTLVRLSEQDLTSLSRQNLSLHLQNIVRLTCGFITESGRLGSSPDLLAQLAMHLRRNWLKDGKEDWDLLLSFDDQRSQAEAELCDLARATHDDHEAADEAWKRFFQDRRHLYLDSQPLGEPQDISKISPNRSRAFALFTQWRDNPTANIRTEQLQALQESRHREAQTLAQVGGLRARVLGHVLGLARRYSRLRVDRHEPIALGMLLEHDAVAEVGRRLQALGLVGSIDDVFYLGYREIIEWLESALSRDQIVRVVTHRKDLLRRWARYSPPKDLQTAPGDTASYIDLDSPEQTAFQGQGVSPGRAQGRARVISSLGEAVNLQPGEVLVCREPAFELSPLFSMVSAVVAETGGPLDHSATLVREFSVPAIFGAPGVMTSIHTGDEIGLDAQRGLVVKIERPITWDTV